ncbi:hypothetical protein HER39_16980, partial [Arthrobacter deserti]|nr:hypothetical protein [Arthrobacter deserti]
MAYDVRLTAAADSGLETSGGEPAQSSSSLAEALEQAERMAARPGPAEAVVYDVPEGAGGGSAGTEIARYSAGGGWTSEAITPASWWAGLSQPTKEKLKSDPYGEVPPEVWDELAAAGG